MTVGYTLALFLFISVSVLRSEVQRVLIADTRDLVVTPEDFLSQDK